ncbi:MAG: bifunctional oligoribonuclease/PAP phosphatase NrnA [Bacilli bacterium]|nr:bifunctional oligoribonuclease/PAP phosphatase NrnA [Bacilli bacterium]
MYSNIYEEIKKYDKIVIARHIGVDPDALASQVALREAIKLTFPNKQVYAVGNSSSKFNFFPKLDRMPSELDGLLIIVDTPDKKRVDIPDMSNFSKTIKIDHHPWIETFCDIEYIDDKASSASEIILDFINNTELLMNEEVAEILFMGIVSDTNRFLFSTTSKTFLIISNLLRDYSLDVPKLYENIFLRPLKEIRLQGYIEQHMNVSENGLAHIMITNQIINELGVDSGSAGNLVNNLNNISEVLVWVMISEDVKNGIYKFNIRSRGPIVNTIAERYNGGGHKFAAGARVTSKEDVEKLLKDLDEICFDYINMNNEV